LNKVSKDMGPSATRILAYMFKNIGRLKAANFQFGQRVYFCLGEDYLSHYFKGYVIGISHDKQNVFVSSRLNNAKTSVTLSLLLSTILTEEQFLAKRKTLKKKKRLSMPTELRMIRKEKLPIGEMLNKDGTIKPEYSIPKSKDIDYNPPTLDTAPVKWLYPKGYKLLDKKPKPTQRLHKDIKVIKRKGVTTVDISGKRARKT